MKNSRTDTTDVYSTFVCLCVYVFVYLQRGPSPGVGLRRRTADGHRLEGPFGASALCGVRNKRRVSAERTCWKHSSSAAPWGQRSADNRKLRRKHQVKNPVFFWIDDN